MSIPLNHVGNKVDNLKYFKNNPEVLTLYKKILNEEISASAWIDKNASPKELESVLQFIVDFNNGKINIEEVVLD